MIANPPPWPGGARCAVAFTFDMDADSILHLSHHRSADTRIATMSALRYGPEVAVPRLVALYREFDMRQTFFLPAWVHRTLPPGRWESILGGRATRSPTTITCTSTPTRCRPARSGTGSSAAWT